MKRIIAITLLIIMVCALLFAFSACDAKRDDRLQIVVTIFPEYDWVMNVLGENADWANVTLLLDSGADLHSYQPSVADMVAVAEADLFLYVGGESDDWVPDALKNKRNKTLRAMNLLSLLGEKAKAEEIVDGMEQEEECEDEEAYDEHVWLSLKNAAYYVGLIRDELSSLDPDHAEVYEANAAAYLQKLRALDLRYEEAVEGASQNTLLFGDRFPFRYLVDDYDLNYYAAFVGCSASTKASFETIAFLAGKVDEYELKVIFKLESSDGSIAESIKNASQRKNQQILVLDSLQSATKKEYAAGRPYLAVMESNLTNLQQALA